MLISTYNDIKGFRSNHNHVKETFLFYCAKNFVVTFEKVSLKNMNRFRKLYRYMFPNKKKIKFEKPLNSHVLIILSIPLIYDF